MHGTTTGWAAVVERAREAAGPRVRRRGGADDLRVGPLLTDSRDVRPGALFGCVRGATSDGHRHAAAAVDAGAVALLVDRPVELAVPQLVVPSVRAVLGALGALCAGDPARRLQVVGVTGSNGKTTTSTLVHAALEAAGEHAGVVTTVGARLGGRTRETALTTPEAPELHRLLRWMVDDGATAAVVEASSIALDVGRLDGLAVDVAVFTGLEQDHLDHHGTIEHYWASKALLFAPDRAGAAVVVTDSPWGRRLADQVRVPVTRVGTDADADVRVLDWRTDRSGTRVLLDDHSDRHLVRSRLVGSVHVANLAAAWATARRLGLAPDAVSAGLAAAPPPPGRNTLLGGTGGRPLVVVDYAHTPAALSAALTTARDLAPGGQVHLVLGARGGRDRYKRQGLGTAARAADTVWLTNEGSHGEDPRAVLGELAIGLAGATARVRTVLDRGEAIASAVGAAGPGDVVLVVGRGHETLLQDAPGPLRPELAAHFCDTEAATDALARRGLARAG